MAEQTRADEATRFKPGWQGGPGRPKSSVSYADIIRKKGLEVDPVSGKTNMEILVDKAFEEAQKGTSWAVQFLVDRVEGKAMQRQEVTTSNRTSDPEAMKKQILMAAAELNGWEAQKKNGDSNEPIAKSG